MEESPMIEDPRKQQMKALKGEMVRNIIISLLIAVVIFVGLSGLPLSGAPKAKQIASAQATFDGKTVEVSQQDMQIAQMVWQNRADDAARLHHLSADQRDTGGHRRQRAHHL